MPYAIIGKILSKEFIEHDQQILLFIFIQIASYDTQTAQSEFRLTSHHVCVIGSKSPHFLY